ncbi:hypothetical protein CONCODRAFT_12360 [Conidiobolus coronatus NRRL 28638]|uniref:Uncharacterized protein n=1 Tax=Conidiobolus coronatus (strain ATCC 28846 / CBS 209.66 / NRRL 28638) TaxID=796925 RepID=A0A137NT79_CONC2|nr:hypothetical protein CONCODRAFT_12360 [Conidiobolus coronatus NRRL 28638]|eukprot:KXN65919.1 hypothetical protein CONCODRAFT_12360 [Conidiobolus coronatus NRRL 28638]
MVSVDSFPKRVKRWAKQLVIMLCYFGNLFFHPGCNLSLSQLEECPIEDLEMFAIYITPFVKQPFLPEHGPVPAEILTCLETIKMNNVLIKAIESGLENVNRWTYSSLRKKIISFFISSNTGPSYGDIDLPDPTQIGSEQGTMFDPTALLAGLEDVGLPYLFANLP